jgi:integrase-like protein
MDGDSRNPDCAPEPLAESLFERLIGSVRRECLDHVIVFHKEGLRRTLKDYFEYYERCRTHLSLKKDAPVSRPVELPSLGHVIEIQKVGGLHHLYTRKVA